MCYLYVYICLWMYWISNIVIMMYMYLTMLYPINDLNLNKWQVSIILYKLERTDLFSFCLVFCFFVFFIKNCNWNLVKSTIWWNMNRNQLTFMWPTICRNTQPSSLSFTADHENNLFTNKIHRFVYIFALEVFSFYNTQDTIFLPLTVWNFYRCLKYRLFSRPPLSAVYVFNGLVIEFWLDIIMEDITACAYVNIIGMYK